MKKPINISSIDITATIKWKCPECNVDNVENTWVNPYRAFIEYNERLYVNCSNCNEGNELNFNDNETS